MREVGHGGPLDDDERDDLVIAVNEAVTNAVCHGSGGVGLWLTHEICSHVTLASVRHRRPGQQRCTPLRWANVPGAGVGMGHTEPLSVRAVLGELVEQLNLAAPDDLFAVCAGWLRRHAGARDSQLLLVDYGQTVLEPVPETAAVPGSPSRAQLVREGPAGTAYREQRPVHDRAVDATVVYLPVTVRTERLGVLQVELDPTQPGDPTLLTDAARVLAHVLAGARRYTDRYEMLRRRQDLGLAAEIQWELLPVLAYELPAFSVAGALEPTYDIGGDTFDYAVSATRLTVTITARSDTGCAPRCWAAWRSPPCATPAAAAAGSARRPPPPTAT